MIFYYDNEIKEYEEMLNFTPVIISLENKYKKNKDSQILVTLLASAWYYFLEGQVNQNPINYDDKFLFGKWKYYIDIGLNDFCNDPIFCLIAGYTLLLHGFYFDLQYEKKGLELIKNCLIISDDRMTKQLAEHFINGSSKNSYKKLENAKEICNKMFPTKSILDNYFREILK